MERTAVEVVELERRVNSQIARDIQCTRYRTRASDAVLR